MGDLRYNFIADIAEPQTMSPWGIMVDAEDPLTGEKIAGSVNIWGARTDHAAAQLADPNHPFNTRKKELAAEAKRLQAEVKQLRSEKKIEAILFSPVRRKRSGSSCM
jgi:hypothetical protein